MFSFTCVFLSLTMEQLTEAGAVTEREELMVSPAGDSLPTMRLAHFLQPSPTTTTATCSELPSCSFSSLKLPSLKVNFKGWQGPQRNWKEWVGKMAALHEPTWRKAGIFEAVMNSTYGFRRNIDLVLSLVEKWSPETNSFVFPWGEATITLEDMMVGCGFPVTGSPVFIASTSQELREKEEKLNWKRLELNRVPSRNAEHCLWMKEFMNSGCDVEHEAFLALWLSRFVFPIIGFLIPQCVFPIAVHLAKGIKIALAPAVLASIYRDLSFLKKKILACSELGHSRNVVVGGELLEVSVFSPMQLVQIWAWERFMELRPEPNVINIGEPRFARWGKLGMSVENVRKVLDSSGESFDWRPYVKALSNWRLFEFYVVKEMQVVVDADLSEEMKAFARCLRVFTLVGLDCVEQYFPHRVAMQFGIDQDIPGCCVAQEKESGDVAWRNYSRPIGYSHLYVPSRYHEGDVTTRYATWWEQSWLRLQGEGDGDGGMTSHCETTKKRQKRLKRYQILIKLLERTVP